jgi:predicted Zn-dependent peptidase
MSAFHLLEHRLRRRRLLALGVAAAATGLLRLPPRIGAQPTDVVRETLGNGLVVLVDERRTADSVAVRLSARAGSRDDGMLPGLAEMTLLMMTAGTRRRPSPVELARAVTLVGGTFGSGVGTEQSFLNALVPATEAEVAFDLLADIARNPLMTDAALMGRRQAMLQTQNQILSDPSSTLTVTFLERIFAGHPASTPLWGTPASVQAIGRNAVLDAYGRFWNASNLVLTVVGKIEVAEALTLADRHFGALSAGARNDRAASTPAPRTMAETVQVDTGEAQSQFRIGFHVPGLRSADRYAMSILSSLMNLRLFLEIRSERGLAYSAGASYTALTDTGAWSAVAGTDPSTLEQAIAVARDEIRRLVEGDVTQAEVDDRINQFVGSQVLADETNANRAARLASVEMLGDVALEGLAQRVRMVTAADVHRVAREYLDLDRALTVIVGPRPRT